MGEHATWHGFAVRSADSGGDGMTVSGIAVPYDEVTEFTPHGRERFLTGSMTKTVKDWLGAKRPLKVYRTHDHNRAIGHVAMIEDTPLGVAVQVRLADTPSGREAADEVGKDLLDSFSVGFQALRDRVRDGVREIVEARLLEVSLVPMPAYDGALVVDVRSAAAPLPVVPPMPPIPAQMLRDPQRFGYGG